MTGYLVRRLAAAVATFLGTTTVVFLLLHAVPGEPAALYAGFRPGTPVPAAVLEEIRAEYGFEGPVWRRYARWIAAASRLDFGTSLVDRRPVLDRIAETLPLTLQLNLAALLLSIAVAYPLGVAAARRPGTLLDRAVGTGVFVLFSIPAFWAALLLIEIFSLRLGILPLLGAGSVGAESLPFGARLADRISHMILPVLVLSYGQAALLVRYVRSAFREVLSEEYIVAARARGVSEAAAVHRHALGNALVPIVSLLAVLVPALVSGTVIVEQIFQWDGTGKLFFASILARDYPTILGLTTLGALATVLATFLADLVYGLVDPRLRAGEGP